MRALGAFFSIFVFAACAADPADDVTDDTTDSLGVPLAAQRIPVLRGVDRASVLSVHEARLLRSSHGVRWTGVYIGGACNGGSGWTKRAVEDIANATHWKFMPIWVGQQSPSICGAHTLSYNRGRIDGNETATRMREMGWKAHRAIPVALDVEAGTYFYSTSGSTAYVRGWVNAVHAAGYRAYVYGSPFGIDHFHDARVKIDAAWAASYFYSGFRNVAPAQLSQMGSRFRHSNRAWQYAGNFFVSGVGDVDADTSHLLLAPAPGGTNLAQVAKRDVPTGCGALEVGEGLARGESIASCDGSLVLALGDDGELALTSHGAPVWTAGTLGAGETAVLDDNGELVVYDADANPVFTTDTAGVTDARLELRTDGLALVDDGVDTWTTWQGWLVREPLDLQDADAD